MLPHLGKVVAQDVLCVLGLCRRTDALEFLEVFVFQVDEEGEVLRNEKDDE